MAASLRQYQQLIAIAECRSFRRAAERLFIAQPALSVSIRKLETEVGVPLLERSVKGVALTMAGQAMLEHARAALFHAEQAALAARMAALGEWGTLRLGFVASATHSLLPLSLGAFRGQHPNVKLQLQEDSTVGLIAQVHEFAIDVAVVRGPIAEDPALESWIIERDDLVLAVPADHPLAAKPTVTLQECRAEGFVLYGSTKVPGLHSVALGLCYAAGFTPRINQEAIQVPTLLSLVASGMGIALVPGITRSYSGAHVRFLNLTDAGARNCLSLLLVTRKGNTSPLVGHLRECMRDVVAAHPSGLTKPGGSAY